MEPFIVSARKYRPETFEDVVGQSAITKTLENAIESNHLAQALLFTGPRGVGKTTCARILAKKINQHNVDYDANEDFAFNIFELDAASNNSVDGIRELIAQVRIPPQVGKYKIYIIDEVHMLSSAAFNAFLKTLEEPPAHAIFILATTEKHKIIPTILSRCQIFDFKRITVSDMREHLKRIAFKEGIDADEEALQIIAQKADGALRDSLSIFDRVVSFSGKDLTIQAVTENLNVLDRDTYFSMTSLILENNIPQLLIDYDQIMVKGFDGQHFLSGLASHFRDLMVCKDERTIVLLELGESTKKKYLEQSRKTDLEFLKTAIEITNNADLKYRNSRNQRLLVELCLMQLASILLPESGEKKKPLTYILPAKTFENAVVSEPAAASINQVNATSPAAVQTSTETEASIDTSQEVEDDSVIKNPSTSAEHTVSQETQASTNNKSSSDQSSLEEKRKALLQKGQKRVSTLSIQGMERKKEMLENQKDATASTDKLPEKNFSQEELTMVWNKYADHLKERGDFILSSILGIDQPKLKGTTIHLKFPNASMKEDLEKEKGQILEFLKRELQNYLIDFEIDVDKTVTKKYIYTDQDKFNILVEKNPAVDLLRRTFNLEF
ncbi:DNA polymerase III subunit gamma/tau [Nonlabens sp. YIK11]|uniref:DNA polymerase III subunit gamma/tau n=1 Tax=Nonlabens sp. YIK11 TaxID=1453349 RepID=UPI0006DC2571|nr:DNA polymerase III subunit gamma/tau [Nonlabens sp. YIK11]KQC33946.1 DNA polymerase III subunit gamma/tau [Nonlabens sp. YIK11]